MRIRAVRQQEKEISKTLITTIKNSTEQEIKAKEQLKVIEEYEAKLKQMEQLMKQKDEILKRKAEEAERELQDRERVKYEKQAKLERRRQQSRDAVRRQKEALDALTKEREEKLKEQLKVEETKATTMYNEKMRATKVVEIQKKSKRQRTLVLKELDKVQTDLTDTFMKRNTRLGIIEKNDNAFDKANDENKKKESNKVKERNEEIKTLKVAKSRGTIAIKEELRNNSTENDKLKEDYERIEKNLIELDMHRKKHLEDLARKREKSAHQRTIEVISGELIPEVIGVDKKIANKHQDFFADMKEKKEVFEKLKTYLVQGDVEPNSFHFSVSLASENNSLKPIEFDLTYTEGSNYFEPPIKQVDEKRVSFKEDFVEIPETKTIKPILKKSPIEKHQEHDIRRHQQEDEEDDSVDMDSISESFDNIDIKKYLEEEEKYLESLKDDYEQITIKDAKVEPKPSSSKNPPIITKNKPRSGEHDMRIKNCASVEEVDGIVPQPRIYVEKENLDYIKPQAKDFDPGVHVEEPRSRNKEKNVPDRKQELNPSSKLAISGDKLPEDRIQSQSKKTILVENIQEVKPAIKQKQSLEQVDLKSNERPQTKKTLPPKPVTQEEEFVDIKKYVREIEAEEKTKAKPFQQPSKPKKDTIDIKRIIQDNKIELSSDDEQYPIIQNRKIVAPSTNENIIEIKGVNSVKPKQSDKEEEELKKQKMRELRAKRMAYKGKK